MTDHPLQQGLATLTAAYGHPTATINADDLTVTLEWDGYWVTIQTSYIVQNWVPIRTSHIEHQPQPDRQV